MTDFLSRPLGARPSKADPRDYPVRRFMAVRAEALPAEFTAGPEVPVYDQDIYGMCVAFTLAEVKESEEGKERGQNIRFSPAFIYGNRRDTDWQGEGMEPREALKALQSDGACPWDMYPIWGDYPKCKAGITQAMRDAAKPYVIKTYARAVTIDELKAAIYHTGPCLLAIPVYESFYQTGKDGIVPPPSGKLLGYHAMMDYGWTTPSMGEYWRVQNSWGTAWGDGGRCQLPLDYFTLSPDAPEDQRMEAWTVVDSVLPAAPFPDVPLDRWSAEAIRKCKDAGLMVGEPDGNFYPARPVTREELAAVIARGLKL